MQPRCLTTRIAMWLLPVLVLAQVFPTALRLCSPCRAAEVSKRDKADSSVVFTTNVNRSNPSGAYCPCKRKSVAASLKSPFVEACESITDALPQALLLARTVAGQLPLARPGVDENVIAPSGSPVVDRAVAWIDCTVEDVYTMGDHHFVLGRVRALDADANHDGLPPQPLVFYRGTIGGFSSEG